MKQRNLPSCRDDMHGLRNGSNKVPASCGRQVYLKVGDDSPNQGLYKGHREPHDGGRDHKRPGWEEVVVALLEEDRQPLNLHAPHHLKLQHLHELIAAQNCVKCPEDVPPPALGALNTLASPWLPCTQKHVLHSCHCTAGVMQWQVPRL